MKKTALMFSAIAGFFIFAQLCFADGMIVIEPPYPIPPPHIVSPPHPNMPLSIKYHKVQVEIDNQIAITKVDQVFTNPYDRDLEGTYLFPIPKDASVRKFSMWVDGEELEGRILDADEARGIYEDIVRRQKDPALLEYAERGLFKARVYPIPANGEKRITLEYEEILTNDNGLISYKYSLDTEKFSVKPLEIASVNVEIISNQPILNVYSPSHKIDINRINEKKVGVYYAEENTKPADDLLLYYTVSTEDIGLNLLTYKEGIEEGFFLAMASPNMSVGQENVLKKNVMFILDTSGSMLGEKIEQARNALVFCLNTLNEGDKFNLVDFNTSINSYRNELIDVSSVNVKEAVNYVKELKASGGTDIDGALAKGLSQMEQNDNLNIIIFLTDGLPTVGETSISNIIKNVKNTNQIGTKIFAFGVGYNVNTDLLDKMALNNNGDADYVEPDESVEIKVGNFFAKVSNPVLTDVELISSPIRINDIYPAKIPDIFKGTQLFVLGRYEKHGESEIRLTGEAAGEMKEFIYDVNFPEYNIDHDYLARIWAARKIGYLLEEIRLNGVQDELVDEIVRLSKKYGIVTPYTSYLVDMDSENWSDISGDELHHQMLEQATRSMNIDFTAPAVGTKAVGISKGTTAMQLGATVPLGGYSMGDEDEEIYSKSIQTIQTIAGKTFYLMKGIWTDATHDEKKQIIKIIPYSQAYFTIMKVVPKLNQYLSIGEKVIVNLGEYSIQITEEGKDTLSSDEKLLFSL